MEPIPYEIIEAMVQCFGKCFHYKDGVAAFFLSASVPKPLVDKHRPEPKFVWARRLLTELGESDNGRVLQRKVLTALCRLRDLPDVDRASAAQDRAKAIEERASKLEALRQTFNNAAITPDRQSAGYTLQDLLEDLFGVFETEYRKSFRNPKNTQEIDGHFYFLSFDYLVEAKWRKDQPTESQIAAFKHKVEGKFSGTRGLFVSIPGFRKEVVQQIDERGSSIILMDGMDLIHVLEGRVDLRDGLRKKVEAAAQKGLVLTPICP